MKPAAALALVAMEEGARVGKVPFYGRGQQGQLGRGRDAAQRHGAVSFVRAKLRGADLAFAHAASLPDAGGRRQGCCSRPHKTPPCGQPRASDKTARH